MKRTKRIVLGILGIIIGLIAILGSMWCANKYLLDNVTTIISQSNIKLEKNDIVTNNEDIVPPDKPIEEEDDISIPDKEEESSPPEKDSSDITTVEPNSSVDDPINTTPPAEDEKDNTLISSLDNEKTLTLAYILPIIGGSLLIILSILYLIMSHLGKNDLFINRKQKFLFFGLTILLSGVLSYGILYITNGLILENKIEIATNKTLTNYVVDGQTLSKKDITFESNINDKNAVLVNNGGNLTIEKSVIDKASGDTTNRENSEFYGTNAALLVQKNSMVTIKNSKIVTNAFGANAIFATGENAKIYVNDTKINTSKDSSRGLDATYGGYIEADNVDISTKGQSCATLATDRGEGTIMVTNSTLSTKGAGSPIVYSTGNITLTNSIGTSIGSQNIVIEGKNSVTIKDTKLTSYSIGNRNSVDNCGVMIYQSMSGDASVGQGTLTSTNSTLTISKKSSIYETAPMFFVTNTTAVINLTNNKLNYGSNLLLSIKATGEWGKSGNNGGNVTLNANNQTLKGNIEVDNISTLEINMIKSKYIGIINSKNTAKKINITLDKESTLTLSGDSYVTSLMDSDTTYGNIISNGYIIYYDQNNNSSLQGKTITLNDGGKLVAY